ncbi:MAG: hypothetical protein ABIK28_25725 [Planctomycetota bacterium]
MKKLVYIAIALFAVSLGLALPVDPEVFVQHELPRPPFEKVITMDLSSYAETRLEQGFDLLFIHHSCGGQLMADAGIDQGEHCIYASHPNGGGLRRLLEENGYAVHEASYSSALGERTDLFDWLPKFRDDMDVIRTCSLQDTHLPDSVVNRIVLFKSCYPNNNFVAEGTAPGNPAGPDLTVWNAKSSFRALLNELAKHPDTLFVCLTAPPLAPKQKPVPLWKAVSRKLMGKGIDINERAAYARSFNNWLKSTEGWLHGYGGRNVAVFDYYHLLTGEGRSDLSAYPTGNGYDSHPSHEGNRKAAEALVPFLNRAVRRAELRPEVTLH